MTNNAISVKDAFLMLVSIGIETVKTDTSAAKFFSNFSQIEWSSIREMADKQGVSAIVLDGLSLLVNTYGKNSVAPTIDRVWWQQFVYDWMGTMSLTEHRNRQQMVVMNDMASRWSKNDCKVMVFKGQASATMYPKPEYRSPGDIDCYLFENYAKGNTIAKEAGASVDESWYKHSSILYRGETFENHRFFVHTRDGQRGKRLEKELEESLNVPEKEFSFFNSQSSILIPPVQWNAMFLTYHSCAHFLTEGLRMKQVLDWAMLLEKHQDEIDWPRYYAFCDKYHLRKFTEAVTAICVQYFGVKIVCKDVISKSAYAEMILNSALYDDDYVFSSGEGGWRNRWHLVKNMFRYRWKYSEIYDESIFSQLWYDVSGFIFHTE